MNRDYEETLELLDNPCCYPEPESEEESEEEKDEEITLIPSHLFNEAWDGDPAKDRNKFIGGSDVGTILGVNKFKSPYQLFLEKTGQIEPENIDNKLQVKLGHKMEQVVAELYEEEVGCRVQQSLRSYRCKEYPYFVGHIDRKVVGKKKGLEIKTTSSWNKTDYKEGEVPPSHYYQALFYMVMTGYREWDIATLRDNNQFYISHVAWDEEQAEYMIAKLNRFWKCVLDKTWDLEIDGSDATTEIIGEAYPMSDSSLDLVPVDTQNMEYSMNTYLELKDSLGHIKNAISAFENSVKAVLQNSEVGIIDGTHKVTWKTYTRKGAIDMEKLQKDHPDIDFESYRKPSTTYRKFDVKELKAKEIENK